MKIDKHNKNIWMFWHDPDNLRDPLAEMCYNSWVNNYPDYTVNMVNMQNVRDLLDCDIIDPLVKNIRRSKFGKTMTGICDMFRVLLIHKYGGIYVDVDVLSIRRAPEFLLERDFLNVYKGKTFKQTHTPDTLTNEQFLSHINTPQSWILKANTDTYIVNRYQQEMIEFCTNYNQNRRSVDYRDGRCGYFFCGNMLKVLCKKDTKFCTEMKKLVLSSSPSHLQSKKWLFFRNKEARKYTSLTEQERQYIESGKLHHTLKLGGCKCPGGYSTYEKNKYFNDRVFAPDTIISKIREIYIK